MKKLVLLTIITVLCLTVNQLFAFQVPEKIIDYDTDFLRGEFLRAMNIFKSICSTCYRSWGSDVGQIAAAVCLEEIRKRYPFIKELDCMSGIFNYVGSYSGSMVTYYTIMGIPKRVIINSPTGIVTEIAHDVGRVTEKLTLGNNYILITYNTDTGKGEVLDASLTFLETTTSALLAKSKQTSTSNTKTKTKTKSKQNIADSSNFTDSTQTTDAISSQNVYLTTQEYKKVVNILKNELLNYIDKWFDFVYADYGKRLNLNRLKPATPAVLLLQSQESREMFIKMIASEIKEETKEKPKEKKGGK